MKKLLASVLVSSLFIAGCTKDKVSDLKSDLKNDTKIQDISKLPQWVLIPAVKEGVAGVGIASPSKGGLKFQIPLAETDARANIAVAIQSEISRITKEALRESNVGDVNDVEQVFSQATKEVVRNLPMSGAKRTDIYQGEDGTLYIRMVLKNDDYSQYLANSQKIYEQRLKEADLSRDNLNKAQVAVKELFDELEKERQN